MAKPSDTVPQKVQEAIFGELLSRPENQVCADCTNKGPTWVSIDYGVFLCMRCSGVHRQLGPHITRVRSTKLDSWKKENIEILAAVGNKLANDYYEFKLPKGFSRLDSSASMTQCRKFVDEKYVNKKYVPKGYPEPVKEFVENRAKGVTVDLNSKNYGGESSTTTHPLNKPMLRKKSLSLEDLQAKKELTPKKQAVQEVDFLSSDDYVPQSSNNNDDFGDFTEAKPDPQAQKKQIDFGKFSKSQNNNNNTNTNNNNNQSNDITQLYHNSHSSPPTITHNNSDTTSNVSHLYNQNNNNQNNNDIWGTPQFQNVKSQPTNNHSNNNNNTDLMKLYGQSGGSNNNMNDVMDKWNNLNIVNNNNHQQQQQQFHNNNNNNYNNWGGHNNNNQGGFGGNQGFGGGQNHNSGWHNFNNNNNNNNNNNGWSNFNQGYGGGNQGYGNSNMASNKFY